ncbi:hypothetical protein CFC21_063840 [Triticum aestivum]|uniref:Uncharacterized protein n=3 Tax=Triticum TaxID=4564 RepID=A0A9R0TF91_TRITD|nr:hypothetical protein CFC21_063840 [Triticum aestivum]VAI12182.1 unnamed protein product [Triticum turgidum subsp. durum]
MPSNIINSTSSNIINSTSSYSKFHRPKWHRIPRASNFWHKFLCIQKFRNLNHKGKWKAPLIGNPEYMDDSYTYAFDRLMHIGVEPR